MKVRPHPFALLVLLLSAVLLTLSAAPVGALAADDARTGSAKADAETDAEETAADRRAAKSEYEREKLDPAAFSSGSEESGKPAGESQSSGSVLRFVFGLAVVLATIYGVHWLLKQWGQSKLQGVTGGSGIIDVVATTSLAQGRALHLVRVGSELVLVGATEQSITRIGELDADRISEFTGDRGSGEFQAVLNGAMGAGTQNVPVGMTRTAAANPTAPFFKRFLDNLRMSTAR